MLRNQKRLSHVKRLPFFCICLKWKVFPLYWHGFLVGCLRWQHGNKRRRGVFREILKINIMKSIEVNRPTKEGFEALKKCMYEFTGQTCWLLPETYYYIGFVSAFWYLRNEIKKLVKSGETPKYSFINYETRQQVPYIYNRLVF